MKKPSKSRCRVVKVEVVSKGMGVGENGAKVRVAQKCSFTHPRKKLQGKSL
jgi:hypothetical protein